MGLAIKSAIEEGAEEYDLLHGNEAYKSHWSYDSRGLIRLEMYPPRALGWICRLSVEMERGARRIVRRMLPKVVYA
jgi:CelD/BcsL family acetyltransferase involved in cellulose biosynthesis